MKLIYRTILLLCLAAMLHADDDNPLNAGMWHWSFTGNTLTVELNVPKGYYLYAHATAPLPGGKPVSLEEPIPVSEKDETTGGDVKIFPGPGRYLWRYSIAGVTWPLVLSAKWQGCRKDGDSGSPLCLMPGTALLATFADRTALSHQTEKHGATRHTQPAQPPAPGAEKIAMLRDYRIVRSAEGYLPPAEFNAFLSGDSALYAKFTFSGRGLFMTILLALLGGLALNLTPCVLPLIPVNLAMIGATDKSHGRKDRIARGCSYGAGIAVTYGLLGLLAVLTGSTFGQIDSSWIFNAAVCIVFLFLAAAMFDFIQLDFSRFSAGLKMPPAAHYSGVFLMGALSALLAGACVAPVLAAALLQASSMMSQGNYAGLLLPFLLGVGMALPWPFAAAGLSLFPKPGKWMVHVKHVLGILILALACWYGYGAFTLLAHNYGGKSAISNEKDNYSPALAWSAIDDALRESAKDGKPVLLDFWATWCKSCAAMNANTLKSRAVAAELEKFHFLKIQAERPSESDCAKLLKEFQVRGLPTYVILRPEGVAP